MKPKVTGFVISGRGRHNGRCLIKFVLGRRSKIMVEEVPENGESVPLQSLVDVAVSRLTRPCSMELFIDSDHYRDQVSQLNLKISEDHDIKTYRLESEGFDKKSIIREAKEIGLI